MIHEIEEQTIHMSVWFTIRN